MEHIPGYIKHIIRKLFEGGITTSEKQVLNDWYRSYHTDDRTELTADESEAEVDDRLRSRLQQFLHTQRKQSVKSVLVKRIIKSAVAAAVLTIGALLYFTVFQSEEEPQAIAVSRSTETKSILPGADKAILTLADGTTVVLDAAFQGGIDVQGNTVVENIPGGLIRYRHYDAPVHQEIVYNTVSTPRGGQYQLELSDRTKVWLNAASSIRFPTEFSGEGREVEITGEVYFEVFHDPDRRFIVTTDHATATVLGTSFSIKAYQDEKNTTTTLIDGSLQVKHEDTVNYVLVPGDQLNYTDSGETTIQKNADVEAAIAWKNGKFIFNNTPLYAIMKQTERWYDVDVVFEANREVHFTGELSRGADIKELLRKLELTNEVRFKIDGKTVTVLK